MTTKIIISAIIILTLASCNSNRTQETPNKEIPKALEDKSSSYEIISKRGSDDLVESLYNELVSKNIDLKKLEDKIDELNAGKNDTINLFYNFNEKNQSYFNSADRHISEIKDSVLKNKMKLLIASNLAKYNSSILKYNELLKVIEAKSLTISDLHNILKIVRTLPLIEKYQKDYLPSKKAFESYVKQQDETIKLSDSLSKK